MMTKLSFGVLHLFEDVRVVIRFHSSALTARNAWSRMAESVTPIFSQSLIQMIYRLKLQNHVDGLNTTTWSFLPPSILGRDGTCSLCIDHESISRKHCQFTHNSEGALLLKDLESMNGTYVNDVRIQQRVLMPGDIVQVGALRLEVTFSEDEEYHPHVPVAEAPKPRGSVYETQPMKKVDPLPPPPPKPWWKKLFE